MKTTVNNISKKEIVKVLRNLNVTEICQLYKKVNGAIPTEIRKSVYGIPSVDTSINEDGAYKCLYGFKVYQWAKEYATNSKMDRDLYHLFDRASHHWAFCPSDDAPRHCKHGYYEPLRKQKIVDYLLEQIKDVHSNYAKRPMLGHTHLYFNSPVYGFRDYNGWCALSIEGNEKFCEALIKYADKFFAPVYDVEVATV